MTNTNRIEITKKGNAVGFTATGETVTGQYLSKSKCWAINVTGLLIDTRNRRFADLADAKQYAATLIDAAKTNELSWW